MTYPGLRLFRSVLFVVGLFGLTGCGESHSWRQKTILEVETPNGVVSGGSVVEVSVRWFGQLETDLNQGHALKSESRGEASFVEVAPGRYLFALSVIEPLTRTFLTIRNVDDVKAGGNPNKATSRRLETSRESRAIPPDQYPMLVTFDDINDPKSVKLVDPANLAATFGEGFKLRDIKLEITGEKVTTGEVEKVLPWWNELKEPLGDGKAHAYGHPLYGFGKWNFVRTDK